MPADHRGGDLRLVALTATAIALAAAVTLAAAAIALAAAVTLAAAAKPSATKTSLSRYHSKC